MINLWGNCLYPTSLPHKLCYRNPLCDINKIINCGVSTDNLVKAVSLVIRGKSLWCCVVNIVCDSEDSTIEGVLEVLHIFSIVVRKVCIS